MTKRHLGTIGSKCVPLLGWAVALQLWFAGPHLPHVGLYESLCFLIVVFGAQTAVTDANRIVQYLRSRKRGAITSLDTILTARCLATSLLLLLEIATTLWDTQHAQHFPLLARVAVLTVSLPIFAYTSRALYLRQNAQDLDRRLRQATIDPRQGVYS